MTDERIRIEVADHVATVTMVRGDKHNALDSAMFTALLGAVDRLKTEVGLRAVVLHGQGPSFCSGLDVASFMGGNGDQPVVNLLERPPGEAANTAQRVATGWGDVPVPVIAAVHGNCFGGGLQIALGADIRFAAPASTWSVMEVRWGLVPDMGITRTITRLMPIDRAKELTFTGRRVDGAEAVEVGLATRVADDPLAAALELAHEIAGKSPHAVRAAKRLYDETWVAGAEESLLLETELQTALLGSPNQLAAVTAGLAKQPAEFTDPE
jgi:enoyl-CoA hydratase/carnithine racemase